MASVVIMPKAGQSMEEGKIVAWSKQAGDKVKKGDVLLEVETDKAVLEVESQYNGILREILAAEGDTVPVLVPIAIVAKDGESYDRAALLASAGGTSAADEAPAESAAPAAPAAPAASAPAPSATSAPAVAPAPSAPVATRTRIFASPAARRIAREQGLDLSGVPGTGPNGRIRQADVKAHLTSAPSGRPAPAMAAPVPTGDAIPLSRMRQAIGVALQSSKVNAPHFYVTVEVDMTAALAHRGAINNSRSEGSVKVSVNDYIVRAAALALEAFPAVNCHTDGKSVTYKPDVNIGMAVNLSDGLVVPVLLNANRKSLAQTAAETKQLALNAQQGRLIGTGKGTFTISNMGMYGVKHFTAIINPPEAAILAVGATQDRVVAVHGLIGIRKVMELTLSSDHRVIDGVLAAQFLSKLKSLLESPESL